MKVFRPLLDGAVPDFSHTIPVVIPESLQDLQGPREGVVHLPLHLDWTPSNTYDLANPVRLRTMYVTVLREAKDEKDVIDYVDFDLLQLHWADLRLPRFTREAWKSAHPSLTQQQLVA